MNRDQARELIKRYIDGIASTEEKVSLEQWYVQESRKQDLSDKEMNFLHLKTEIWGNTLERSGLVIKPRSIWSARWSAIAAAAILLLALSVGLNLYIEKSRQQPTGPKITSDVAPGGNKAILTLANGNKVVLNDLAKGQIFKHSGISVSKSGEGELIYTAVGSEGKTNETAINTITTPKGGQYTVMLSDGTKVMLNSASSLTFPSSFNTKIRQVELSGEAYFEVASNKQVPFLVLSGMQTVRVLGTQFNVNAYSDEASIKTTLLEGAVNVITPKGVVLKISPGQQVVTDRLTQDATIERNVNIAKETSWIDGVFSFEGDNLQSVMRQIARWYDVDINYIGPLNNEKYFGEISKSSKLSEVFKILEFNNVQFKIIGKTVDVSLDRRPSSAIKPK